MRRREFITILGNAVVVWPLAVHAQQGERMRRIGVLMAFAEGDREGQVNVAAFREGLQNLGWAESDLMPGASFFGVLLNPKLPAAEPALRDVEAAAKTVGVQIQPFRASNDDEIDAAFEAIARAQLAALAIIADPFFDTRRQKLVALAAHYAIPTIYHFRAHKLAAV